MMRSTVQGITDEMVDTIGRELYNGSRLVSVDGSVIVVGWDELDAPIRESVRESIHRGLEMVFLMCNGLQPLEGLQVAGPECDTHPSDSAQVRLLQWSNEAIVRRAIARCHGKDMASEDMIRKVIQQGHESVLEHWYATFDIHGISRACLAQLTRHRIASYSVRSQRYCDESDAAAVIPDAPAALRARYEAAYRTAFGFYKVLLDAGVPKEDARLVLPEGTLTDLILTMNARELRHFFRLRLAREAQWEIRELATRMLELVREKAPNIFGDIKAEAVQQPGAS